VYPEDRAEQRGHDRAEKEQPRSMLPRQLFCMPSSRPLVDSGGSRRQHILALGKKIGNNHDE